MSLLSDFSKRIFFIFGQTHDLFFECTLERKNIKEKLYDEVKNLSYQRIVFYNHERKIYFADEFSKKTSLDLIHAQPIKHLPSSTLSSGPLGDITLHTITQNTQVTDDNETALHLGRLNDALVLNRLDAIMKDAKIKSAIIIDNADTFIRFFGLDGTRGSSAPMVNSKFNDWENIDINNENIIIFIFPHRYDISLMRENYRNYDLWATYMQKYFNQRNGSQVIEIKMPSQGEIKNMLNHHRVMNHLQVDLQDIDYLAKSIQQHLYRKQLNLRDFEYILYDWTKKGHTLNKSWIDQQIGTLKLDQILTQIHDLIGMESFKHEVNLLLKRSEFEKTETAQHEKATYQDRLSNPTFNRHTHSMHFMHYAFLGNPGTGKSTAAKLLGQLLASLGYLPSDHYKKVTRDDLVGQYIGQTEIKTRSIIEQQMGGVLFIDEAYSLHVPQSSNDYGRVVIDTLVDAMSEHMGEFSVILAGYTHQMDAMLREANPGLAERIGLKIHIEDYTPNQLYDIFVLKAEKAYVLTAGFSFQLKQIIQAMFEKRGENWANARVVEKMLSTIDNEWPSKPQREFAPDNRRLLKEEDIPESYRKYYYQEEVALDQLLMTKLRRLSGGEKVAQIVERLFSRIKISGKTIEPGHFCFIGSPGTGKTTVARTLAETFKAMGILRSGHMIEAKANDLIGNHVGESIKKTSEKFKEALDGILFIDEVYSISENQFASEAIPVINDLMEHYRSRICVIIAGYESRMENFLKRNEGLQSRIDYTIKFANLSSHELMQMLIYQAQQDSIDMTEEFVEQSTLIFNEAMKDENFGNARYVRTYFNTCCNEMYHRLYQLSGTDSPLQLTVKDIPKSYRHTLPLNDCTEE